MPALLTNTPSVSRAPYARNRGARRTRVADVGRDDEARPPASRSATSFNNCAARHATRAPSARTAARLAPDPLDAATTTTRPRIDPSDG
jgi:hypothetical protein